MSLNKELETCFLFKNIQKSFKEGLKRIKPEYYVIRKDKFRNSGGLLTEKLTLMKILS